MKFVVKNFDEVDEALEAIIVFYQEICKGPAHLHLLLDILVFAFGEKDGLEAAQVVGKAIARWYKKKLPRSSRKAGNHALRL